MTYVRFLEIFLLIPIAVLAAVVRPWWKRRHSVACVVVCVLAFIYTSPWDNHAAAVGLWSFDPRFAPPSHFVLHLPWEEYAFYLLQGVLTCLLVVLLCRKGGSTI